MKTSSGRFTKTSHLLSAAVSALLAFGLTGCVDISGKLTVQQPIELTRKKNIAGTEKVTIEPGQYSGELKLREKKRVRLRLKDAAGRNRAAFDFKVPQGVQFPTSSGTIELSANQVDQPFDIAAELDREVERTPTEERIESCVYYDRYYHCRTVCPPNRPCRRVCGWETISRPGRQLVRYHYRITSQYLDFELREPGTTIAVANFDGSETKRRRVVEYQSVCR